MLTDLISSDFSQGKGFKKSSYQLLRSNGSVKPLPVLVHYTGNHELYKPSAHSNAIKIKTPFRRTEPSTLAQIKKKTQTQRAVDVYRQAPLEFRGRNH
jgi:hypothetical protein